MPKNSNFTLLNSIYNLKTDDSTINNQQTASGSSITQTSNNFKDIKNDEDIKEELIESCSDFDNNKLVFFLFIFLIIILLE